jgi:signal transduction histidine kinase
MQTERPARSVQLGFAFPIALLIALTVVSYRSVIASTEGAGWVRHTYEVIEQLSGLLSDIEAVETGSRGFALVGDDRFLAPYESGLRDAPIALASIDTMTADNVQQQVRVHRLAALIEGELRLEGQVVQARRDEGASAAAARVVSGDGLRSMDEIRALIRQMQLDERMLLVTRQATADKDARRISLSLALGIFVAVILLSFAARMVSARQGLEMTLHQSEFLRERDAEHARGVAVINQELEAFSYTVSHDLRAPLRHINGYVEMLQRDTAGQLSERSARYLTTITDASLEMGRLIDDLLAFSRVGKAEFRGSALSLNDVINESILTLETEAHDRRIEWHVAALPRVIGDAALLKQAMTNLLDNALKYSRARDPAVITVGSAGEEGKRAVLFVRDNGVGFDMRYVHKLFGVFERLHPAEEFEGTGIGLATVRRIITRHGGRVWAEGSLQAGATFYFTLELS